MAKPIPSRLSRRSVLLGGAAIPLVLGANGCGYLLYPGRQGRRGGTIDMPVLIIDLLWLLPGIVPGAICLIVDFASGCIYGGGGDRGSVSPVPTPTDGRIASAAVAIDGAVVANAEVQPDLRAHLVWDRLVDHATLRAKGRLLLRRPDGASAETDLRDLI